MAQDSKIQWTNHTQNFWRGCSKVHTGCENCYAESHFSCLMQGVRWGTMSQGGVRKVPNPATWNSPFRWNEQSLASNQKHRVFCMSLGDLFENWPGPVVNHRDLPLLLNDAHQGEIRSRRGAAYKTEEDVLATFGSLKDARASGFRPATLDDVRRDALQVIQHCSALDWLLLTKHGLWKDANRITQNWPHECSKCGFPQWWTPEGRCRFAGCPGRIKAKQLEHVWLLGSVSDQQTAEVIVKQLQRIKQMGICRYVGLSAEPLVGSLRLRESWDWLDWVIVGGESIQGGACRQLDLAWAESLVGDCRRLGIACYVKQLGSEAGRTSKAGGWRPYETEDKKGGAPAEWPAKLRVRRFPNGQSDI